MAVNANDDRRVIVINCELFTHIAASRLDDLDR